MPPPIKIFEVGPRDGLQNEKVMLPVHTRVEFIHKLHATGLTDIEIGGFVSPRWSPQLANTDKVAQQLRPQIGVRHWAVVPNQEGFLAALHAGIRHVAIFAAASETFNQKDARCSIDDSFQRFIPLFVEAQEWHIPVRGYISCIVDCPYEGKIDPRATCDIATRLLMMGCQEISLGETLGTATPLEIKTLIQEVKTVVPVEKLAIHCHDTYGKALDNIWSALEEGITIIEAAVGGLGRCPYAKAPKGQEARGNVATEKVVAALEERGIATGINLDALIDAGLFINHALFNI